VGRGEVVGIAVVVVVVVGLAYIPEDVQDPNSMVHCN
jgi:hypothetical protein